MSTATVMSTTLLGGPEPVPAVCAPEKTSNSLLIPIVVDASEDPKAIQDDGAPAFTVELRSSSPEFADFEKTAVCESQHFSSPSPDDSPLQLHVDVSSPPPDVTADASDSISVTSPSDPPGLPGPPMVAGERQPPAATNPLVPESHTESLQTNSLPSSDPHAHGSTESEPLPPLEHDALLDIDPSALGFDMTHFLLDDILPLDTLIPSELIPDDLLVHDMDNITGLRTGNLSPPNKPGKTHMKSDLPVRYVRMYPEPTLPAQPKRHTENNAAEGDSALLSEDILSGHAPRRVAHLYLQRIDHLGSGNHSTVFRGGFRLKHAHGASMETRQVAVKTAGEECGAHAMLLHEARMYNAFPRALMEGAVPALLPTRNETSKSKSESEHQAEREHEHERSQSCEGCCVAGEAQVSSESVDSGSVHKSSPSPPSTSASEENKTSGDLLPEKGAEGERTSPVVPKFFGFYAPAREGGDEPELLSHHEQGCGLDSECGAEEWPTGLLLVEDCGKPIEADELELQHRKACFDLVLRLQAAGFTNCSMYARNMVVQPGPLSVPRNERSMDKPSFRIIDFGRAERQDDQEFEYLCDRDQRRARQALKL